MAAGSSLHNQLAICSLSMLMLESLETSPINALAKVPMPTDAFGSSTASTRVPANPSSVHVPNKLHVKGDNKRPGWRTDLVGFLQCNAFSKVSDRPYVRMPSNLKHKETFSRRHWRGAAGTFAVGHAHRKCRRLF